MDDEHSVGAATLADRAFDQLSAAIIRGDIPAGSKLSEPLLASQLGLSRGPLREAIRRLQERELVTQSPRLGARVVELDKYAVDEIYAIREVLEGLAAREASQRITDSQADELQVILDRHAQQLESDGEHYGIRSIDDDFHVTICSFSGNQRLRRLLCGEYYQVIRLLRSKHAAEPKRARIAFVEHKRIAEAIIARDGELAELLMRRHIQASRKNIERILESADSAKPSRKAQSMKGRTTGRESS